MSHKALIGIVGPSGSGKSTSLRNLNPETTVILDGERKGFPFKGSEKFRIFSFTNPQQFKDKFAEAKATEGVDLIVVESFTKFAEQAKKLCQDIYKGYEIWSNYAKNVRNMLNDCKNDKCAVCFTAIDEIVEIPNVDGSTVSKRLISIDGKELKGKIEYEFLMVFYTEPRKSKDGKMEYWFQTNTDGTTTAKTPMLMFPEQLVPNDLAACLEQAKKFYTT